MVQMKIEELKVGKLYRFFKKTNSRIQPRVFDAIIEVTGFKEHGMITGDALYIFTNTLEWKTIDLYLDINDFIAEVNKIDDPEYFL